VTVAKKPTAVASPAMAPTSAADASDGAQDYISQRLKQYQGWYDGKAVSCKRRYMQMRCASVLGGAVVPVLVNVSFDGRAAVTTVLSLIVVVLVSLEGVLHYREQWKNYRSTEQYLGREEVWFRERVGPYADRTPEEAHRLLVERIEDAIAAENAATLNTMTLAGETSAANSTRSS
jgi:hypothetical protein